MEAYAGDRRLVPTNCPINVVIRTDHPMSLSEMGQLLTDLDTIFNAVAKALSGRLRGSNTRKKEGILVATDYRSGSLEILADPYFQGVASSTMSTLLVSTFVYVLRRARGKPDDRSGDPEGGLDRDLISDDGLRSARTEAIQRTAQPRRRIRNQMKTFGLAIVVSTKQDTFTID